MLCGMFEDVLRHFPADTHALTLASDPDGLLQDERLRAALGERGFRLIEETDPIRLRYEVQRARPWTADRPVVVVTAEEVDRLPYDLWQQGRHVALALHTFFPQLDYQVVRLLSPRQRRRLAEVMDDPGGGRHSVTGDPPGHWVTGDPAGRPYVEHLSPEGTQRYLLQSVFEIAPSPSLGAAELIRWLDSYHAQAAPMPIELQRKLVAELKHNPALEGWPLHELVASGEAYRRWMREAWVGAVGATIREPGATYMPVAFDSDTALQELVPRLLRSGTLQLIDPGTAISLPAWAQPALATNDEHAGLRQFAEGLTTLDQRLKDGGLRWKDWQESARLWARLCVLRWNLHLRHPFEELWRFKQIQQPLDIAFQDWLAADYARLAAISLPYPNHVHHVPAYLAQQRQENPGRRQALLIMDGMSLPDWLVVRGAWEARHPDWQWKEGLVLAQAPSITSVSRQALVSGRRPGQFAGTLLHNRNEAAAWKAFWGENGVPNSAAVYLHLSVREGETSSDAITSRRTQVLCLISTVVDDMVHGATQGAAEVHASLHVWLNSDDVDQPRSAVVEAAIQQMLDHEFSVTITSDHGHVGAEGIGQPQEGTMAVSRGKRARLYSSAEMAALAHGQFPQTVVWHDDGLLPTSNWVVMPRGRGAFAPAKQMIVGHGGLTIDEMVVPLVTISQ